jgi:hypothetical protein
MKAVKKTEFERVIVDTTVQEKAITHPTELSVTLCTECHTQYA